MLETIDGLPVSVLGLRVKGEISKDDYEHVVLPELERARSEGRRVRLLYHLGPEFERFSAGAMWQDMKVGMRYLRLVERCAIVTDVRWVRNTTQAVAPLMPCPVRIFANAAYGEAVDWLASPLEATLSHRIVPDRQVLVVEPRGKLRAEDFDVLGASVDAWTESAGCGLQGIVVHVREFPSWENVGALLRHVLFVRDYHRKVRRIALASESVGAKIAPALAEHFVQAQVQRFDTGELDRAITWAGSGGGQVAQALS